VSGKGNQWWLVWLKNPTLVAGRERNMGVLEREECFRVVKRCFW